MVTGGGRGVGQAIARGLAARGAQVAVVSRSAAELEETVRLVEKSGGRAIAVAADVTDADAVGRMAAEVLDTLGEVTLLVNNAGSAQAVGPLWEVDSARWWGDIENSLRGTFLCSRTFLPDMLERGQGRILNVSSYVAARPSPHVSGYAAAKAAVLSLTEALAAETRESGVRVFAITPGRVRTELTRHMFESDQGRRWLSDDPAARWVEPSRVADLVAFLASGRGDELHGRFLHALDDFEELVTRAREIQEEDLYVVRLRR